MKILTLNTWQERGPWRDRWEITLEGIAHFQPDIVGFQELFNPSWVVEIKRRTGFAELAFLEQGGGLALYTRYPLKSWRVQALTKSPLEDYLRYALWSELDVNGKSLFAFNTHFSWMLEDGETRRKQVEEVLRLVEEKARDGEVVLMGDLNAPRGSREIEELVQRGRFRDVFFEKHPEELGYTWDNRNPYVAGAFHKLPDRRIDFILTRGPGAIFKNGVNCELVFTKPSTKGVWASDHYGVLAEFQ